MKRVALFFALICICLGSANAQSLLAAASQSMKLPEWVGSVAIWPIEIGQWTLDEQLLNMVNDEIEQAVTRKAREKKLKVLTRRQLQSVVREIKLSSTDKTSFEQLGKLTGSDVVVMPTASLSKSQCMTIVIKVIGVTGDSKGEVISASKSFKVNAGRGELDMSGCDD